MWKFINPSTIAQRLCTITCYWGSSKSYRNSINRDDFKRKFHLFDCYCNRTFIGEYQQVLAFPFLILEGLLIFKDPSLNCTAHFHPEVAFGVSSAATKRTLVEYKEDSGANCPPFKCHFINNKLSVGKPIIWDSATRSASIDGFLPLRKAQAVVFCNASKIDIYDYSKFNCINTELKRD